MTTDIRTAAQATLSCVEFLPGQYKNSITSDQRAVFDDLRAALAQPEPEPNMRHPKIQALIGSNARKEIIIGLVEQILDGETDFTALDMEYWDSLHDRAMALMEKAAQPQQAAARTHVLVPLRMTQAMRDVTDQAEWDWGDLLAAAEAATEDECAIASDATQPPQAEPTPEVDACIALLHRMLEAPTNMIGTSWKDAIRPVLAGLITQGRSVYGTQPQHIDNITNNKV